MARLTAEDQRLLERARRALGQQPNEKKGRARLAVEMGITRGSPSATEALLWHTPDGEEWASFERDGHLEHWSIRGKEFKLWLRRSFYERYGDVLSTNALRDVVEHMAAQARFDGDEFEVFARVAKIGDEVYLDLGGPEWNAIRIAPGHWEVVDRPPVRFRRRDGQRPYPMPERGGEIDDLRPFVNIVDEDTFRLFVVALVSSLRPAGPYVAVVIRGEQGTAKTTICKVFRRLVDPHVVPLRRPPREDRDLSIAAQNSWLVAYDNLSSLPLWLSDTLCAVTTGGGFGTRMLYTDDEEKHFAFQRPVLLNGIEDVVIQPDLRDRQLTIDLNPITKENRIPEQRFWAEFDAKAGRLFGAVLDAYAGALACLPTVELPELPRMADFAVFGVALEHALRWPTGSFLRAYEQSMAAARISALDDSLIAKHIRVLAEAGGWQGQASELLACLNSRVAEEVKRDKRWPKAPHTLSGQLRRLAPDLRAAGWAEIDFDRKTKSRTRVISIDPVVQERGKVASSASERPPELGLGLAGASASPAGASASPAGASASPAGASASPAGASASPAGASASRIQADAADAADAPFPLSCTSDFCPRCGELLDGTEDRRSAPAYRAAGGAVPSRPAAPPRLVSRSNCSPSARCGRLLRCGEALARALVHEAGPIRLGRSSASARANPGRPG